MRLLADESLAGRTRRFLRALGHDVLTLNELGRVGAVNGEVLSLAQTRQAVVVTEDRGIGNLVDYPPGTHRGIIVLKVRREADIDAVHRHLAEALQTIPARTLAGSLLIIDRNKSRLRRHA